MDFNNLIGNSKIKEYLTNVALTNQNLHSYIFSGREGIGKKLFAINFAKMLLCLSESKPCNSCKSCISFEGGNHTDFMLTNESKLLNTVKSRCVKIEFSKLTNEEINNYLQGCGASKLSNTLLEQCDGSLKKALTIGDKAQDYETVEKIINNLDKVDIAKVWNSADLLYKSQDEILDFLDYINVVLYNKLIEKDKMAYINSINVVEQTKKNLLANANYNMCIDNLLLKLWEEFNEQNNRG